MGSVSEGRSGTERVLCSFFLRSGERGGRMGQTEGVMAPPWALPGRSFGWGGACVCSEASVSPTILAGADPACQSPARAISGVWNLGQRRGGTEGVLTAGKLVSPQQAGGGGWASSMPCPGPLRRGPPLPGSHHLSKWPSHPPTCWHMA